MPAIIKGYFSQDALPASQPTAATGLLYVRQRSHDDSENTELTIEIQRLKSILRRVFPLARLETDTSRASGWRHEQCQVVEKTECHAQDASIRPLFEDDARRWFAQTRPHLGPDLLGNITIDLCLWTVRFGHDNGRSGVR